MLEVLRLGEEKMGDIEKYYAVKYGKAKFLSGLRDTAGKVVDTILHGGLLGAEKTVVNPWTASLKKQILKNISKDVSTTHHLGKLAPDKVTKIVEEIASMKQLGKTPKNIAAYLEKIPELAKRKKLEGFLGTEGSLAQIPRRVIRSLVKAPFGSREGQLQALSNWHKGGLMGSGSSFREAMSLKGVTDPIKKIRERMVASPGKNWMESTNLSDVKDIAGGIAKPLVIGGAVFPIYNIQKRISEADGIDGDLAQGIGKDLGWYIGLTTGMPLGVAGTLAGQQVGKRIGRTIGGVLGHKEEK